MDNERELMKNLFKNLTTGQLLEKYKDLDKKINKLLTKAKLQKRNGGKVEMETEIQNDKMKMQLIMEIIGERTKAQNELDTANILQNSEQPQSPGLPGRLSNFHYTE